MSKEIKVVDSIVLCIIQLYCSQGLSVLHNLCQCYSYSVKASVLPSGNLVEALKSCQHNLYLNTETIIHFSHCFIYMYTSHLYIIIYYIPGAQHDCQESLTLVQTDRVHVRCLSRPGNYLLCIIINRYIPTVVNYT